MIIMDLMVGLINAEVSTRGCVVMISFEQLISRTLRYHPLPLRVELPVTTFNPLEDVAIADSKIWILQGIFGNFLNQPFDKFVTLWPTSIVRFVL
jgi:hypothetical protein